MRVFAIIAVLLLYVSYLGYGWLVDLTVEKNQKICIEKTAKQDIFRGDTTQLCKCATEHIRENPFFSKTDPKFKEEYISQLIACGEVHVQQYGTNQCDVLKKKFKKLSGQDINCSCFNEKMMGIVMKQMNGITPTKKISKMTALNIVSGCLK